MTNAAMASWRWGIRKNCNLMMEISPAGNYLLCMEFRPRAPQVRKAVRTMENCL